LIPGHYPFEIIDITDEETTAEYPGRDVPYLRPEYSVETFAERLLGVIDREELDTRLVLLRPGEVLDL